MLIVASSNAQAKNISTPEWTAKTLHSAAGMRVQKMTNSNMRPGDKAASLERLWKHVRVLVIEEVSMVAARNYNMLNFRAMYGRTKTHAVSERNYAYPNCTFGRCPIVIHLGDFLQLAPTNAIGLITDVNATNEDGSYVFAEPPDLETQSAIAIFGRIPSVIELRGTKRFVAKDPIITMLECMRLGKCPHRFGTPSRKRGLWTVHPMASNLIHATKTLVSSKVMGCRCTGKPSHVGLQGGHGAMHES